MRSKDQILASKNRVERSIALLREELETLENELLVVEGQVKLDRAFFWTYIVPLLSGEPEGLNGHRIYEELRGRRLNVSQSGLRVFLSRYKERGGLKLTIEPGRNARWTLSSETVERADRLDASRKRPLRG